FIKCLGLGLPFKKFFQFILVVLVNALPLRYYIKECPQDTAFPSPSSQLPASSPKPQSPSPAATD
ncbi:MAG: hypothetical protein V1738_03975, partial [Patescibacteria group bacterium]